MINLDKALGLLDNNFSLITVGENKIPNFSWKECQSKQLSKKEFTKRYEYFSGIFLKDGSQLAPTNNIGIVTGYDHLECLDIDLKVFSTAKEKVEFWNEFLSFCKDNIYDFEKRFPIYKTQNEGFHILYKSKRCVGNKKIASLKGHKEAIIESRGIGGYIFVYDGNNLNDLTYKDVQFISDEDRDILWSIAETYNYKEDVIPIKEPKKTKRHSNGEKPCWEDYNEKTSILDLIQDEFEVVRNVRDKYIIKRFGATSPHSGYVYKDSGNMYLFSTGSSFEHEKLYTPFLVYAHKFHNDDLSAASKELYKKGFGDRLNPQPVFKEPIKEIPKDQLIFPIDIFPEEFSKYITVCHNTLNHSVDFMGCSLMFVFSIIIGNSIRVQVKRGWIECANIWMALVGKQGVGKTPSISSITFPLEKSNNREIKAFVKQFEKYEKFMQLSKEDREQFEKVDKPKKSQFLVNDITLEALVELHHENKNGVAVLKDELAGWFKDMNKYRQGSDVEHWLSSWSGKQINLNRKTSKSSFVEKAFIPVIGGIQPSILDTFYTEENRENGFIDRILFSYPELTVEKYNDNELSEKYLEWYSEKIISIYETVRKRIVNFNNEGEIESVIATFSEDAKIEWARIHDKITDLQNDDEENEYMKSMLPKQKSYIPRFALILNTIYGVFDTEKDVRTISKESILNAERLSDYFIAMAKKIKNKASERGDVKRVLRKAEDKPTKDKVKELFLRNPDMNRGEMADILGVSKRMIYKYLKEIEDDI